MEPETVAIDFTPLQTDDFRLAAAREQQQAVNIGLNTPAPVGVLVKRCVQQRYLVPRQSDPDGIAVATTPIADFSRIEAGPHPFVSRGDQSGKHSREIDIWDAGGSAPFGSWYRETGTGMGPRSILLWA